jgi:hypothetical protein
MANSGKLPKPRGEGHYHPTKRQLQILLGFCHAPLRACQSGDDVLATSKSELEKKINLNFYRVQNLKIFTKQTFNLNYLQESFFKGILQLFKLEASVFHFLLDANFFTA